MSVYVFLLFAVIIAVNVVIIRKVYAREDFSKNQKTWQTLLVVFIPLIGAVIVWGFHRSEDDPPRPPNKNNSGSGLDNYTIGGG